MSGVGCALLAAGASLRMGSPKQLLLRQGEPLVRYMARQLIAAECQHVAVVLGCRADEVATALHGLRATRLDNPGCAEGIASSVRAAVDWAEDLGCGALLLTVCDQPLLTAAHVDALIRQQRKTAGCVASGYAGTCGVPAVLPASAFHELRALVGDRGAATVMKQRADLSVVAWPDGAQDVDTPADALHAGLTRP